MEKKIQKNTQLSIWWKAKSSNLPCRFSVVNSVGTPLEFAVFRGGFDVKYSKASAFCFFLCPNRGFCGGPNTFCQEKHQHFHVDRQLVKKKKISSKINIWR